MKRSPSQGTIRASFTRACSLALTLLILAVPGHVRAEDASTVSQDAAPAGAASAVSSVPAPIAPMVVHAAPVPLAPDGTPGQTFDHPDAAALQIIAAAAQKNSTNAALTNDASSPGQAVPSYIHESVAQGSVIDPASGSNPGSFAYQFALALPPGRSGMTPDLTLSYSSSDHEDAGFGYGWSLSIPYIERYDKNGIDAMYSTSTPSTSFYSSLSGELVPGANPGTYLARNDDGSDMQYAFANGSWTATTKSGITYVFGADASAREDDSSGSEIFKWMLEKEIDANGNTISYTYTKDAGQIYPSKVAYTINKGLPGTFSVLFKTRLRTASSTPSYTIGFPVQTNYQINQITIQTNASTTRQYALAYQQGDNGSRLLLSKITETGFSLGSVALPPTVFGYSTSNPAMATSTWANPIDHFSYAGQDMGVVVADVNGDGLADLVQSFYIFGDGLYKSVNLNTGSGWTQATSTWSIPCLFATMNESISEADGRLQDVNGDGLPDFICGTGVYLDTGTNWISDPVWDTPVVMTMDGYDAGVRFADVNGDGLPDLVQAVNISYPYTPYFSQKVYLNTGTGWQYDPSWVLPSDAIFTTDYGDDGGARLVDVNGDGLADLLVGYDANRNHTYDVYINTGHGWVLSPTWTFPTAAWPASPAVQVYDVNGDGLPDIALGYLYSTNQYDPYDPNSIVSNSQVYLNTGSGWALSSRTLPFSIEGFAQDTGFRTGNISGNGLSDIIVSSLIGHMGYSGISFAQGGAPDLLKTVTEPSGKRIAVTYGSTSSDRDASGTLLNPNLAFPFPAVNRIDTYDGIGATSTETYQYNDGSFYYGSATDRKFGGFGSIDTTDPLGNVAISYYHTGAGTDAARGEYADDEAKIGKPYRTEQYDGKGSLFSAAVTKWDALVNGLSSFVLPIRTTQMEYDGGQTHKDSATELSYDPTNGNLLHQTDWGEVSANNDGSFADIGNDAYTTDTTYATGPAGMSLPSEKVVKNQKSAVVSDIKYLYDLLPFGTLSKGNLTETDSLKTDTTGFASEKKTYNQYGLVSQDTDPLGNSTNYSYDSYYLYPTTVTNALGQKTSYTYNYAIGQPLTVTDPNGLTTQTAYDPFGRVLSMMKPDPANPSNLVPVTTYSYADTPYPRVVQETDYLDATTTKTTYRYLDGYGRVIEERAQAQAANTYAVTDTAYNGLGLTQTASLPYFSTGVGYTAASAPPAANLLTTYVYDPLQRVLSAANVLGTTKNAYHPLHVTTTDADGHAKDFYDDAYGNLAKVVEHNQGANYTTSYAWDFNKDLTKITDALGNIRNFTYDDLGHELTAQDLHAPADTTFGTWNYAYDDAGNLSQSVNPQGQMVKYGYDPLNRAITEDYQGAAGTEITYGYDTCTNGIGKLCSVAMPGTGSSYLYDADGNMSAETDKTGPKFLTTYFYDDRQGNPNFITYPDGAQVAYNYDSAGFLSAVQEREASSSWSVITSNMTYSPLGQLASMTYGNGVVTTNTYDPAKLYRLANRTTTSPKPKTGSVQNISYTYDPVGNIKNITDTAQTDAARNVSYQYDDLNRLTSAIATVAASTSPYSITYTYDALGNLLSMGSTTYAYTASGYANPDAVTSVGAAPYTYDQDGNLLTNGSLTNTWNYKDQLTKSVVGSTTSTYLYDQNGNRVEMKVGSTTTYYPNQYYSLTGAKKDSYVYADGSLVADVRATGATTTISYIHPDHLGSTNVVTNMSGAPIETLAYEPYGSVQLDTQTTSFGEPKTFIGQYDDSATNLDYLNARYYDGTRGQFLSQDPIFNGDPNKQNLQDPQSLNAYSYAENNPITSKDPSGNFSLSNTIRDLEKSVFSFSQSVSSWVQGFKNNPVGAAQSTVNAASHPATIIDNTFAGAVNGIANGLNESFSSDSDTQDKGISSLIGIGLMANFSGGTAAGVTEDAVIAGSNDMLSPTAQAHLQKYEANGWQQIQGRRAPSPFFNKNPDGSSYLPQQAPGYYTEYDANARVTPERFVRGQNGELYYTNTHYGDDGMPAFINIPPIYPL